MIRIWGVSDDLVRLDGDQRMELSADRGCPVGTPVAVRS